MSLTLTDQDLAEFNTYLMRNCRGDEVAAVQTWLVGKQRAQAMKQPDAPPTEQRKTAPEDQTASEASAANGHDKGAPLQ